MKHEERLIRNEIIINLSNDGFGQEYIAKTVNITQQMVSYILKKQAQGLPTSTKESGLNPRLTADELQKLPVFLSQGAEFYGFEGDFWTHARVGFVIEKEFNILYSNKQAGRILILINWTRQKPQKKNIQQNQAHIEKWENETLPSLKKKP